MIKLYSYRIASFATLVAGSLLSSSGVAFAQGTGGSGTVSLPTNIITTPGDVVKILCGSLLWMFWGALVFGVAMFLYGGYIYASSSGNSEKVTQANKTLLFAALGIVIALLAYGVPFIVGSFLTVPQGQLTVCG